MFSSFKYGLLAGACAVSLASFGEESLSLARYCAEVRSQVVSRIGEVLADRAFQDRVAGTVTLVRGDGFFLQGQRDALKVILPAGRPPSPGDVVEAEGSPSLEGGSVVFVAKKWRKTGESVLPEPRTMSAEDAMEDGASSRTGGGSIHWRRVRVAGRALERSDLGFAMDVEGVPMTVLCETLPDFLESCGETRPLVEVTGVVDLVLDQSVLFGRDRGVLGVKIYVDKPENIVLRPDAAYLLRIHDRRVRLITFLSLAVLVLVVFGLLFFLFRQLRRQFTTHTIMQERKRMADDLHDTIEQHLVGAGMLLQLGQTKEVRDILLRAKREMRDIVWGLKNDDMMRQSPAEMIRAYVKAENRKGICRIDCRLAGLPAHLDAASMRDLSLILREAVGNAIKHGKATKIALSCDPQGEKGWLLRIANNGTPYDAQTAQGPADGHFGLEGMRSRARRLGGDLTISLRGEWTVVSLNVV